MINFPKHICLVLLTLVTVDSSAFEDGSFDMITMDYHADENHDVVFFGASAYSGLDRSLQEKFSVQIISRSDDRDEPKFYWSIAAGARYRMGRPVSPFVGLGFSFGETSVCRHEAEDDDPVRVFQDGEEICIDDTLFAAFGEYGIYWLISGRLFIELSRKHNYTSKQEPFDSVVNGFSIGFRH